ncbi:Phospholipase A1-IIgamma [Linum perenne]
MNPSCCSWLHRSPKTDGGDTNGGGIAKRWKQLSGEDNWKGLLDPLDIDLRRYIIHYGEMAQATYDAFNTQKVSRYAGSCLYSKSGFFDKVGLGYSPFKYKVTKFLYATSAVMLPDGFLLRSMSREAWSKESNWMGYVAVATDEGAAALGRRDIVVAWRGTVQTLEWVNDLDFLLVSGDKVFGEKSDVKVHQGWYSVYTSDDPRSPYNTSSARDQVMNEIKRLLEEYKDEEISITVTGHSLGAAVATLTAIDIVTNRFNHRSNQPLTHSHKPPKSFVYASPLVGDLGFHNMFNSLTDLRLLRIRNFPDPVPTVPPKLFGFFEVGHEIMIFILSPYLKPLLNPHNLELYMHGVAGYNGLAGFKLVVERDIALINKGEDHLKDEYNVPPKWWNVKHKAMYQLDDGSWGMRDYIPPPPEDVVLL